MKDWVDIALKLLGHSLKPFPQELNELDWKVQISRKGDKLAKHLSAFANHSGGGFLVFGVEDKTGKLLGISQEDANHTVDQLANIARQGLVPEVVLDHCVVTYEDVPILLIHIEEAATKPIHLTGKSIEESYVRIGGTTRKASRQELGGLILNSKPMDWETLRASDALTAQQALNLLDYRSIFELLERPVPSDADELVTWLEKDKMLEPDGRGKFYITRFGAISSAHKLDDFGELGRKAVRVIRYKGLNKVVTEKEIVGKKGYAVGFADLIDFLTAMLPQSEVIEKAFRKETTVYPEIALRELIANALIHQDLTIRGTGPMIEIFDNRIEIRNPGRLLASKKVDRLIGTNPESRNEVLASAFRRFNICEERGTGLLKAITGIELYGLPPLAFEEGENYFKVTLFAPKTFAEMTPRERIEACYQHAILKHLSSSAMTNTSLRERLKMSERQRPQVSKLIRDAVDEGLIKNKDPESKSTKFAEYLPYWA
jgi:predicted HTH transcriptional regulator